MGTDSKILYKTIIRSNRQGDWRVDILGKKLGFEEVKFVKIKRSANRAVDWLAKQVKKGMILLNWVYIPLFSLVHILSRDGLPPPH